MKRLGCLIIAAQALSAILCPIVRADDPLTPLMFVGEDISVLTSASRRAESPSDAPAVAEVYTNVDLKELGITTLGEALSYVSGIYTSPIPQGSIPYLRGVPDGILFLYDSVPLTSDGTKNIRPLNEEMSLSFIKRIEVIKGPASVLWGPDAFSGIVNIVPFSGRDIEGAGAEISLKIPDTGAYASAYAGKNEGTWEAFLAGSSTTQKAWDEDYNVVRIAGEDQKPAPVSERYGHKTLSTSDYQEGFASLSLQDKFRISGRWAEGERLSVMKDSESGLSWQTNNQSPFSYLRLEAQHNLRETNIKLNTYYSEQTSTEQEVDLPEWSTKNRIFYAEGLIEKDIWRNLGILSAGISYRYNEATGAVLRRMFVLDFLRADNIFFIPKITANDYTTELFSGFVQLRRHWEAYDFWASLRVDDHSQYDVTISHNAGMRWKPSNLLQLKLVYGSAYRTPYNMQLLGRYDLEPELAQNLSLEMCYKPSARMNLTLTPFWTGLENHIQQDPYAGLSSLGSQDIYGIELSGSYKPDKRISLWANGTFFETTGDEAKYSTIIKVFDNGQWIDMPYETWHVPYDTGPVFFANAGLIWRPRKDLSMSFSAHYNHDHSFYFNKGTEELEIGRRWLFDVTVRMNDVWTKGLEITGSVKNLFDEEYAVPGPAGALNGPPLAAYLGMTFRY